MPELDNTASENLSKLKGIKVTTTKKSFKQNFERKVVKSTEEKLKCQVCFRYKLKTRTKVVR